MATEYIKRATKTPETEAANAQQVVQEMLHQIKTRGEEAVIEYAKKLDRFSGEVIMTPDAIEAQIKTIPQSIKDDITFATEQVKRFAIAQRDSLKEFTVEVRPGLIAGQRLIQLSASGRTSCTPPNHCWRWASKASGLNRGRATTMAEKVRAGRGRPASASRPEGRILMRGA